MDMKVVRDKPTEKLIRKTMQFYPRHLKKLDEEGKKVGLARQALLAKILDQVFSDKDFVLRLKD